MNSNERLTIEYVAENSDHPHAAMIVEWLLTNKPIEYQNKEGDWIETKRLWLSDVPYRFKPEPKPAYRVYLNNLGLPVTITRDGDEQFNIESDVMFVKWLSPDWTEYDPEPAPLKETWPSELVERIAGINREAAKWLRDNWHGVENSKFGGFRTGNGKCEITTLGYLLQWKDTPQGYDFWKEISDKLRRDPNYVG